MARWNDLAYMIRYSPMALGMFDSFLYNGLLSLQLIRARVNHSSFQSSLALKPTWRERGK